jgi:adhesin/invasin
LPWLTNVATFHLTNVAGPAAAITATAGSDQSTQVGATFATPLALRVTDLFGNAISRTTVTFSGPASGAGGTLSPTTATTNVAGVASTSVTADHVSGTWTATASVADLAGVATFHLTNTAGALDHLALSPATSTVTAGSSQTYTAEGFDQFNNDRGNVTGSTTFAITNGTCDGAGCSSTKAGTQTVTGTNMVKTGTASLAVSPAAASQLALSPSSATIEVGSSRTFTVTASDAFGNSLGDVTASANFASSSDGIASCALATCTGVAAGSASVTATYGEVTSTATLTITPKTPAAIAIASGNTQSAAAGAMFAPLTVRVTDAAGAPLTGTAVTFAASAGTAGGVVSPTTTTTDATGLATTTATANTVAGQWTVTAAAGGLTATFALTNTPGPVATVSLSVDGTTIAGDGSTVAIATATVEDANGNPRIGEQVSFAASPSTGVEKSPVIDNLDGSYSVNLGGINGGPSSLVVALTAADNGISDSAALTVTPVATAQPPGRTPVPTPVPTPRRIPGGGGPKKI